MQIVDRAHLIAHCKDLASTPGLQLSHLHDLASKVQLSQALMVELCRADPTRPYGRNSLFANDHLEVMVATWTRGTPCLPHDHGGAHGAVRVLQGQANHRVWRIRNGALEEALAEQASPGDVLACGPHLVHSMSDSGAEDTLMTLHLYTAAIEHMVVYDVDAGDTCVVEGNCGAWIPDANSGQLRSRNPGIHRRIELRAA